MKKVVMMLAIASFMVLIAACGGKKASSEATEEGTAADTETLAPASSDDPVAIYEAFVDQAISSGLYEKAAKGDATAVQEWTKLAQDFADKYQTITAQELTLEQAQKIAEISRKWTEYLQKAAAQ